MSNLSFNLELNLKKLSGEIDLRRLKETKADL